MKIPTIIVVLLAVFFIFKFGYLDNQSTSGKDDVEEVKESLDKIEQTESIDEMVESVDSHNREAAREFEQMQSLAKSDASRQFVAITADQNKLATQGQDLVKKMQPLINSITPEIQNDPEKISEIYTPLCGHLRDYIPILQALLQKISKKQQLVHDNPEISKELYAGQQDKMIELIDYLYSNQSRVYEGEKQAYNTLQCDTFLAKDQSANIQ